jgi:altronate dehydratase
MGDNSLEGVFYLVSDQDNVATALADIPAGTARFRGGGEGSIEIKRPIPFGHKIAVKDIKKGDDIIKYKVPVAVAGEDIGAGEYVHIHNAKSKLDTRSNSFDGDAKPVDIEYKLY